MRIRILTIALATLLAFGGSFALAHEGHDHDKPATLNLPTAPRVLAATPDFELVGVLSGKDRLTIFLHAFATNEPIRGARMTVSADGNSAEAEAAGDGVFTLSAAPWLTADGGVDLVFAMTLADGDQDLLTGRLQNPVAAPAMAPSSTAGWSIGRLQQHPELVLAALGGLMTGVLITLLIYGRASRRQPILPNEITPEQPDRSAATGSVTPLRKTIGASVAIFLSCLGVWQASEPAHAAGATVAELPSVPATMATDLAQRTPDGTLFVPKATQHLLSMRTMLTASADASRAVELTGMIIAGPEHFGRVQPGRPGRIDAAPGGLAYIGKRVEKGQLLGYVQTYIEAADRANIDSQIAETEARIEKNKTILSRYDRAPGSVPQVRVDEISGELDALRRKRAELVPAAVSREPITAPISGIVSVANATIGQIVDARDILFEIVDPKEFWIEAHGYSRENFAAENLSDAAFAVVDGSRQLSLEYVGRGLALKNQATVSTFRILGSPANLSIGMPVRVVLQSSAKVDGFILPASAIVRGETGLPIVWVKTEPERFEPQIVKVEPLDGKSVVVTSGLKADLRIVTDGVTLLNQVR